MVLLQTLHAQALAAHGQNGADRGVGARQRRDRGHALQHRDAADGAVVEERLASERRVDDEGDAAIEQLVSDVGDEVRVREYQSRPARRNEMNSAGSRVSPLKYTIGWPSGVITA